VRAGRGVAACALVAMCVACSSGDDSGGSSATTTVRRSTTTAFPADLIDPCALLPVDVVGEVVGTKLTAERIVAIGGGATCDLRPVEDPAMWTISVFVFQHDTEGNDIDARDAYTRFRAESDNPVDVPNLGDEAFAEERRVGVVAGDTNLDVTGVRFDGRRDQLIGLARRAIAALPR
jgi:hypothetical protein